MHTHSHTATHTCRAPRRWLRRQLVQTHTHTHTTLHACLLASLRCLGSLFLNPHSMCAVITHKHVHGACTVPEHLFYPLNHQRCPHQTHCAAHPTCPGTSHACSSMAAGPSLVALRHALLAHAHPLHSHPLHPLLRLLVRSTINYLACACESAAATRLAHPLKDRCKTCIEADNSKND